MTAAKKCVPLQQKKIMETVTYHPMKRPSPEDICDYIFATSWEVCNKVGGIYTVLSTQAQTLQGALPDHVVYIGPDLGQDGRESDFKEHRHLLSDWTRVARESGINIRIGRWDIPGHPLAVLVDYEPLRPTLDAVKGDMWRDFGVDSLHAYGDYDDASLYALAAGRLVTALYQSGLLKGQRGKAPRVVYQAHEWMSGMGMLYVRRHEPAIATVFTTHATSIGRSIVTNGKPLYDYFEGYHGDQMARELHMEAKHSIERQAAHWADCMTTVSQVTDRECRQLLERPSDVILPNGFDAAFVPQGKNYQTLRAESRRRMLQTAEALLGRPFGRDTLIVSTSGRNDFRCKGFDVFIQACRELQLRNTQNEVLAVIAVPCWRGDARADLLARLRSLRAREAARKRAHARRNSPEKDTCEALPSPFITHELHNWNEDRIVQTLLHSGMASDAGQRVHLLIIPSYLDGHDGVIDLPYYDWLPGCDLCLYPSYYEPWGYTPMEALAFGIPCLTTDLAGIGQWATDTLGHQPHLAEDGIDVIHRSDSNYADAVRSTADAVTTMLAQTPDQRREMGRRCRQLARRADWSHFITYYYEAYDLAMRAAQERCAHHPADK